MYDPAILYMGANDAGEQAAEACTPRPMVVGTPSTPSGNDLDPDKPQYLVEGGVCGFAWVNIRPARGSLVAHLKAVGVGRTDSYYGGYTVWVSGYGQSLARKMAYARAFAGILREAGLDARAHSRMD